jgi:ubiquinone/menaquinone biosynthesis C-methylase UbiE
VSQFKQQYDHLWTNLTGDQEAHRKAVGGDFETVGYLEFQLLRMVGLRPDSFVIDVGCGSGRLAAQLAPWLSGPYLGTDIMGSLLDYARTLCGRPDWSFLETDGFEVPANDGGADFIVFFSVFTHLSHEDTWKYIQEAHRVLKPGGKLVCSFLEFAVVSHWTIFINTANDPAPDKILNQFLSRDALVAFAENAGFAVESFLDGDKANIPIDRELTWQNGARMTGSGSLGQSTCVLVKR